MTRKKQLAFLVGLSAGSAIAQYITQGALASGGLPSAFPTWFWIVEYTLWGIRALVEAWVIVYLFTTRPETRSQARMLGLLEFALIALITLTLGPALRSLGLGATMRESLSSSAFTWWNFGIAAYTSLMMGSAGYAFRVQSDVADTATQDAAALAEQLSADLSEARATIAAFGEWQLLSATARARLIAECSNGDAPGAVEQAAVMGVSASTVRRGYGRARAAQDA